MAQSVRDMPLEEFEKLALEQWNITFPFWKDKYNSTFEERDRWYEYMIDTLIENDRKKDVPIYTEKIIANYEDYLSETIQEYGELSEEAFWAMWKSACVYYDEFATSDCQSKEFYERGLEYAKKFLAVSEKSGNDEFILKAMDLVAEGFTKLGRNEESVETRNKIAEFLKKSLTKTIAQYGEKSDESFTAMSKLANAYESVTKYLEALEIWQRMYDLYIKNENQEFIYENSWGEVIISSLAENLKMLGRYDEEAVMREKYISMTHNFYSNYLEKWANSLINAGRPKESVKIWFHILLLLVNEEKESLYSFEVLRIISRLMNVYSQLSKEEIEIYLNDEEIAPIMTTLINLYEGEIQSFDETIKKAEEDDDNEDYIEADVYYKTLNALANVYYFNGQ